MKHTMLAMSLNQAKALKQTHKNHFGLRLARPAPRITALDEDRSVCLPERQSSSAGHTILLICFGKLSISHQTQSQRRGKTLAILHRRPSFHRQITQAWRLNMPTLCRSKKIYCFGRFHFV